MRKGTVIHNTDRKRIRFFIGFVCARAPNQMIHITISKISVMID